MRHRRSLAALALCVVSIRVESQGTEGVPDERLLQPADSITAGDYCRLAQRIMSDSMVVAALAADARAARANVAIICDARVSTHSLLRLSGRGSASLRAVARVRNDVPSAALAAVRDAMGEFRADVQAAELRPLVQAALGEENAAFVRVSTTAQSLEQLTARDQALRRLAKYERKLGPTSPRLNGVEVMLNFAAQRWIPGFKPTPSGGPSPLEVIAAYSPGYVTFGDSDASVAPVSASEFGLRFYLFGDAFGRTGFPGLLLPSYFAFGAVTASDGNGALVWPWRGRERSGVFFSWGTIKIAYIDRDRGAWLFSRQFQAIPFVF